MKTVVIITCILSAGLLAALAPPIGGPISGGTSSGSGSSGTATNLSGNALLQVTNIADGEINLYAVLKNKINVMWGFVWSNNVATVGQVEYKMGYITNGQIVVYGHNDGDIASFPQPGFYFRSPTDGSVSIQGGMSLHSDHAGTDRPELFLDCLERIAFAPGGSGVFDRAGMQFGRNDPGGPVTLVEMSHPNDPTAGWNNGYFSWTNGGSSMMGWTATARSDIEAQTITSLAGIIGRARTNGNLKIGSGRFLGDLEFHAYLPQMNSSAFTDSGHLALKLWGTNYAEFFGAMSILQGLTNKANAGSGDRIVMATATGEYYAIMATNAIGGGGGTVSSPINYSDSEVMMQWSGTKVGVDTTIEFKVSDAGIMRNTLIMQPTATTLRSGDQNTSIQLYSAGINDGDLIITSQGHIQMVGTDIANGLLAVSSGVVATADASNLAVYSAKRVIGDSSSTPSVSPGGGAGTGGTASIIGTDSGGTITINAGLTPSVNDVIATITYDQSYPFSSYVVVWPANASSSILTFLPFVVSDANGFTINAAVAVGLTGSTAYKYNYVVVGSF